MEIGGRQSNLNTADRDSALVARGMVQARARAKHALGFRAKHASNARCKRPRQSRG